MVHLVSKKLKIYINAIFLQNNKIHITVKKRSLNRETCSTVRHMSTIWITIIQNN